MISSLTFLSIITVFVLQGQKFYIRKSSLVPLGEDIFLFQTRCGGDREWEHGIFIGHTYVSKHKNNWDFED